MALIIQEIILRNSNWLFSLSKERKILIAVAEAAIIIALAEHP